MKNLTYIIPVIEFKKDYLDDCLKSLSLSDGEQLIIVGPSNVLFEIKKEFSDFMGAHKTVFTIENNNKTDFCSQINLGVEHCTTEYFMIVEFDDKITSTWVKNVENYIKHKNDVSLFLPIIELVDDKTKQTRALSNELSWSTAFVNELGEIDSECLDNYYDFQIVGGVFKRSDFVRAGGLKPSLKIASAYELLLRFNHNGFKIFTIPKIGYRHTFDREGSYMVISQTSITNEEGEWLIKTAKEEKLYHEDRNKTFSK